MTDLIEMTLLIAPPEGLCTLVDMTILVKMTAHF
jgi:hypothetical protein